MKSGSIPVELEFVDQLEGESGRGNCWAELLGEQLRAPSAGGLRHTVEVLLSVVEIEPGGAQLFLSLFWNRVSLHRMG